MLAANQRIESRNGRPENVAVITLLVTPEDAAKLTMASNGGKIQLALRNTIDSADGKPAARAASFHLRIGSAPDGARGIMRLRHPSLPLRRPYVVDVISGGKRENKTFPNTAEKSTGESNGQPAESH